MQVPKTKTILSVIIIAAVGLGFVTSGSTKARADARNRVREFDLKRLKKLSEKRQDVDRKRNAALHRIENKIAYTHLAAEASNKLYDEQDCATLPRRPKAPEDLKRAADCSKIKKTQFKLLAEYVSTESQRFQILADGLSRRAKVGSQLAATAYAALPSGQEPTWNPKGAIPLSPLTKGAMGRLVFKSLNRDMGSYHKKTRRMFKALHHKYNSIRNSLEQAIGFKAGKWLPLQLSLEADRDWQVAMTAQRIADELKHLATLVTVQSVNGITEEDLGLPLDDSAPDLVLKAVSGQGPAIGDDEVLDLGTEVEESVDDYTPTLVD